MVENVSVKEIYEIKKNEDIVFEKMEIDEEKNEGEDKEVEVEVVEKEKENKVEIEKIEDKE